MLNGNASLTFTGNYFHTVENVIIFHYKSNNFSLLLLGRTKGQKLIQLSGAALKEEEVVGGVFDLGPVIR